ncbi:MAG: hypothetical protein ACREKN_05025 [Longimicrobiaceae bacterium]
MSSFATYVIGFIILILGLALLAFYLGVPHIYIIIGVIVLIGIGIISATSKTKQPDPPQGG